MADPIRPDSPEEVNLLDVETQECPYPAYKVLRDEAPVFKDPVTGFYTITRYDDLRQVLMDTEGFSSNRSVEDTRINTDRARRMKKLYEEKGWLPAATLAARDDPDHRALRNLFDKTFRAGKIKELDGDVEALAYRLIDDFIDDGSCDWVRQFAVPLPLIIIGRQMGAKEEDIWQIKAWTDAWVKRL